MSSKFIGSVKVGPLGWGVYQGMCLATLLYKVASVIDVQPTKKINIVNTETIFFNLIFIFG